MKTLLVTRKTIVLIDERAVMLDHSVDIVSSDINSLQLYLNVTVRSWNDLIKSRIYLILDLIE